MTVTVHCTWREGKKAGVTTWWRMVWVFFSGCICFLPDAAGWGDRCRCRGGGGLQVEAWSSHPGDQKSPPKKQGGSVDSDMFSGSNE